jgi:hypothetical protein
MNKVGYKAAVAAYKQSFTECTIYPPLPEDDETIYNEQFIQVDSHPIVHVQELVAVLGNAGMIHREGSRDMGFSSVPQLKVLGIMPGCVLFEDVAYRQQ